MFYITGAAHNKIAVRDINPMGRQTILMLHGWPLNMRVFEPLSMELATEDCRVVAMDLRGFGASDAPWAGYRYDDLSADVAAVVNALRLERFALLGFSMGGAVALRYMRCFRSWQVARLLLVSAAAPSFTRRPDFPHGMNTQQVNAMLETAAQDRPRMNAEFGRMFFSGRASMAMREWVQGLCNDASAIGTQKAGQALRDEDLRPDLEAVRVPCGIFHGRMDRICPYDLAVALQAGIPGATLFPFPQMGHSILLEDHVRLGAQILTFLRA